MIVNDYIVNSEHLLIVNHLPMTNTVAAHLRPALGNFFYVQRPALGNYFTCKFSLFTKTFLEETSAYLLRAAMVVYYPQVRL